jgi:Bles03-like protein
MDNQPGFVEPAFFGHRRLTRSSGVAARRAAGRRGLTGRLQLIRLATEQGRLGISAKAATARPSELTASQQTKLICVYTRSWQDHDDVRRVLRELRDLGVTWRLSYKTDEATASGVYGVGNICQPAAQPRLRRSHPARAFTGTGSQADSVSARPLGSAASISA